MNAKTGLLLAIGILLLSAARVAAAGQLFIVDTERAGNANGDTARIETALRHAGAERMRTIHFSKVSAAFLAKEKPSALILSGQATPWTEYPQRETAAFFEGLRQYSGPILGICGGHQALALAFGGEVALLGPAVGGREKGSLTVELTAQSEPLWKGLQKQEIFWFNHREEVRRLPPGFLRLAIGGRGANIAMRRPERFVYGVQFHPEVDLRPTGPGQAVIRNFLKLTHP
jgi:GMP synthase (glutamine-hydrolysing)